MPVVKYPIQHRFGVIANNQKIQLQEQLLQNLAKQSTQNFINEAKLQDSKDDLDLDSDGALLNLFANLDGPIEKCEFLVKKIQDLSREINTVESEIELKAEVTLNKLASASANGSRTSTAISNLTRPVSNLSERSCKSLDPRSGSAHATGLQEVPESAVAEVQKASKRTASVPNQDQFDEQNENFNTGILEDQDAKSQKNKKKRLNVSAISSLPIATKKSASKLSNNQELGEQGENLNNLDATTEGLNNSLSQSDISMLELQNRRAKLEAMLDRYFKHANSAIERAKRRSGLNSKARGAHVNLTVSWTELTILAKIEDKRVKKAALEILCASLSISDLTNDRIIFTGRLQALVFIGQSMLFWLYWLNNCSENENSCLTIEEFLCIRIIYFIFIRLWCYVTLGILTYERHEQHINDLLKYLSVLDKSLEMYRNYPDAAFCIKVILEVSDELDGIIPKDKKKSRNSGSPFGQAKDHAKSPNKISETEAVIMDEILLNDININAKLIRDIAPSLYQAIDLYRRKLHELSAYDYSIFSKSLLLYDEPGVDGTHGQSRRHQQRQGKGTLLDKLFTIGILAVLSQSDQNALDIYQKMLSDNLMDKYDWTENYLAAQLQVAVCLFGCSSEIKRNSLVCKKRDQDQGVKLVEQTWRPRYYAENFGSVCDLLSYYSKRQHEIKDLFEVPSGGSEAQANLDQRTSMEETAGKYTSWIVHGSAVSNIIRAVPEFNKHDPIKAALFNLIQAHHGLYDNFLIDGRILEVINFSKAISDETSIYINELSIWERCADLFSEALLPNMSLTKSLKECKITEPNPRQKVVKKFNSVAANTKKPNPKPRVSTKMKSPTKPQYSFLKRENKKLTNMVQHVWDTDLHSALEQEIDLS